MASKAAYKGCVRETGLRDKYRSLWEGEVTREALSSAAQPYGKCLFKTWGP
jgi:hypothetical protein